MADIEVNIQSILPSEEPQGRFSIKINRDSSVADLLKHLCKEANVSVKPEYCLRSKGHNVLNRGYALSESEVGDGAFLHWTFEDVEVKTCRCNTFWFLAILSFVIGVIGITAICAMQFQPGSPVIDHAIIFDAGSTHTSMFVYKWDGAKHDDTAVAQQLGKTCKVKGHGIALYENNPPEAGKSLEDCLKKAQELVPSNKHSETPIYLGATAGMRLLNESNPKASEQILESVRDMFAKSGFELLNRTTSVRIITGADEGTFSWVTSNYLTNAFNVEEPWVDGVVPTLLYETVGALDLGGASTQITFIPEKDAEMPEEYSHMVKLFGKEYDVYTHSYLCYGVVQVTNSILAALIQEVNQTSEIIEHACLPIGYNTTQQGRNIFASPCVSEPSEPVDKEYTFVGTGDLAECRHLLEDLFNKTTCPYSRCSFNGVYQPLVTGPFFAFSSYFYVADFLNLTKNSSNTRYDEYQNAVTNVCSKSWSELQQIPASEASMSYLMDYCMEGIYISLLLHDNYNFTEEQFRAINFVDKVSNSTVGWTLGFVLNESQTYPAHKTDVAMNALTFGLLLVLFCLFLVVAVGLAIQSRRVSYQGHYKYTKVNSYGAI